MAKHRPNEIRNELLRRVVDLSPSPVATVAEAFAITRQGVQRHFKALLDEGLIEAHGLAPHRKYRTAVSNHAHVTIPLAPKPEEDRVWAKSIRDRMLPLDEPARDILYYGFTEILNNASDHSAGRKVRINAERTPVSIRLRIEDDGIGIFRKVAGAMRLEDRDAPLELAKGKFTTDPKRHTGEGIFFTSRAFTRMTIEANGIWFQYEHRDPQPHWTVTWPDEEHPEGPQQRRAGTAIELVLKLPPPRLLQDVFAEYSSGPEDYRFAKTHVPLRLAAGDEDALVSRSSAKRVLARIDRFDEAVLDFSGVRSIGQAFADEVFRVFPSQHEGLRLTPINANAQVMSMIRRARSSK